MEYAKQFFNNFVKPFCQAFEDARCNMDCPIFDEQILKVRFQFSLKGSQEAIFYFLSALSGFSQFWQFTFINKTDYP